MSDKVPTKTYADERKRIELKPRIHKDKQIDDYLRVGDPIDGVYQRVTPDNGNIVFVDKTNARLMEVLRNGSEDEVQVAKSYKKWMWPRYTLQEDADKNQYVAECLQKQCGKNFIAYEWKLYDKDAPTLADKVKAQRLTAQAAVAVAHAIAESVQQALRQGFRQFDLSPENVIVERFDAKACEFKFRLYPLRPNYRKYYVPAALNVAPPEVLQRVIAFAEQKDDQKQYKNVYASTETQYVWQLGVLTNYLVFGEELYGGYEDAKASGEDAKASGVDAAKHFLERIQSKKFKYVYYDDAHASFHDDLETVLVESLARDPMDRCNLKYFIAMMQKIKNDIDKKPALEALKVAPLTRQKTHQQVPGTNPVSPFDWTLLGIEELIPRQKVAQAYGEDPTVNARVVQQQNERPELRLRNYINALKSEIGTLMNEVCNLTDQNKDLQDRIASIQRHYDELRVKVENDERERMTWLNRVAVSCIDFDELKDVQPVQHAHNVNSEIKQCKLRNKAYLIKKQNTSKLDQCEKFLNELKMLRKINANPHPNLLSVDYISLEFHQGLNLCMIFKQGHQDLRQFVKSRQQGALPMRQKMEYLRDIAAGLKHLSDLKISHCDIKPQNVVLFRDENTVKQDDKYKAVLIDFDVSHQQEKTGTVLDRGLTARYAAPEQLFPKAQYEELIGQNSLTGSSRNKVNSPGTQQSGAQAGGIANDLDNQERIRISPIKTDIYAYGLLVLFMLLEEDPWHDIAKVNSSEMILALQSRMMNGENAATYVYGKLQALIARGDAYSQKLYDIMFQCLPFVHSQRIRAEVILDELNAFLEQHKGQQ